jgi:hypothetical protein
MRVKQQIQLQKLINNYADAGKNIKTYAHTFFRGGSSAGHGRNPHKQGRKKTGRGKASAGNKTAGKASSKTKNKYSVNNNKKNKRRK